MAAALTVSTAPRETVEAQRQMEAEIKRQRVSGDLDAGPLLRQAPSPVKSATARRTKAGVNPRSVWKSSGKCRGAPPGSVEMLTRPTEAASRRALGPEQVVGAGDHRAGLVRPVETPGGSDDRRDPAERLGQRPVVLRRACIEQQQIDRERARLAGGDGVDQPGKESARGGG